MSVLACDRQDCRNVMCDRLILEGSRYICDDCFDELLEAKKSWPDKMTTVEVETAIRNFLESPKGTHKVLRGREIDREFNRLIGNNRSE